MISFSVIIPIYQVERYIQRCLESVITQHFAHADIECILVDDCGTDKSMEIVEAILADYKGPISFKMLRQDKNRGLSSARNLGVEQARGKYVFFIDSDDYLLPDCFQYFIDNLLAYPDVDMIIADAQDCKNNNRSVYKIKELYFSDDIECFIQSFLRRHTDAYAWNKLIKRELLISHSILFVEGIVLEDIPWTYQLALHLKKILFLPKITYVYSYNQSSLTNAPMTIERATYFVHSYTVICDVMLNNPPCLANPYVNLAADYLLFIGHVMMRGSDMLLSYNIDSSVVERFVKVRNQLLLRSLKYGRVIEAMFFMLQYSPLCYLQKSKLFRRFFNDIERIVEKTAFLTNFMHRKRRW